MLPLNDPQSDFSLFDFSLTRELEQQVLDDMPFAFVADQQLIFVYSNKVKGVQINPTEYYLVTNTLSVEE